MSGNDDRKGKYNARFKYCDFCRIYIVFNDSFGGESRNAIFIFDRILFR